MHYLFLLATLVFISCNDEKKEIKISEVKETTTTYYLIRHAEKDRATTEDPGLTEKGKERAMFWATYFENTPLDAVYSTNYVRTKETAAPTAQNKSLAVTLYDANNLYDASFQAATQGKTVLVVGHSNTTPELVNAILGEKKYDHISDTENGMLYKVLLPEMGETTVTVAKIEM